MARQDALLGLACPGAISTAVMTGNLTNTVFSLMDLHSPRSRQAKEVSASSARVSAGLCGRRPRGFGRVGMVASCRARRDRDCGAI